MRKNLSFVCFYPFQSARSLSCAPKTAAAHIEDPMPRKAVEAAAVAVEPPAAVPKSWTRAALDAEAKALVAKRKAARRLRVTWGVHMRIGAGWKRCPTCGPKKGLCKVRACKAAREPLMLGYNPAVEGQEGGEVAA